MQIKGNKDVTLEGRGVITLRPSDHVASGGEGSVYRVANTVVKLYHDPAKMQSGGVVEKVQLLKQLKHPYIVYPRGLVTGSKGELLGYYMEKADGYALPLVFTNDFYQKPGFSKEQASTLVDRMREVFKFGHDHGATLVDPNELNWNVQLKKDSPEPRVFDVDSWAIGKFAPQVIMPSIRDWHSKKFDEFSDWFSWGVVTFQVYTGIHPYKGTLPGFKMGDLEGRMKANASVFASEVRLNRAVRDFSCIPPVLLDWYKETFQKGKRSLPPSPFDTGVTTPLAAKVMRVVTTNKTGLLVFQKIFATTTEVIRTFFCGVVLLKSGILINLANSKKIADVKSRECEVVKTDDGFLIADWDGENPVFQFVSNSGVHSTSLALAISAERFVSYENRMFVVTEQGLTELTLSMFGKPILSTRSTWGVLLNSTTWFNSVGVQDTMSATYVVLPFGDSSCAQVRVRELDGIKVVQAKSGNRFASFVGLAKDGTYRTFDLVFSSDYKTYTVQSEVIDSPELNLAILPKGVCARITEDGKVSIFVPTNGTENRIEDSTIGTDFVLSSWGDKVIYLYKGEVWSLRMK